MINPHFFVLICSGKKVFLGLEIWKLDTLTSFLSMAITFQGERQNSFSDNGCIEVSPIASLLACYPCYPLQWGEGAYVKVESAESWLLINNPSVN